jgi:hypothetical protein
LKEDAKQEKFKENLTAFDVLMNARQTNDEIRDPRDQLLPPFCSPGPLKSSFGQNLLNESRRQSFGSSPNLTNKLKKRGPEHLSSPTSPSLVKDTKKSKSGRTVQPEQPSP